MRVSAIISAKEMSRFQIVLTVIPGGARQSMFPEISKLIPVEKVVTPESYTESLTVSAIVHEAPFCRMATCFLILQVKLRFKSLNESP